MDRPNLTFPLECDDIDADMDGDGYYVCTAMIVDAAGNTIVEEPGPEATWRELQELVRLANLGARTDANKDALRTAIGALRALSADNTRAAADALQTVLG